MKFKIRLPKKRVPPNPKRADVFEDKRTKRARTRGAASRKIIEDQNE